ncbi:acyl-CoA dehydrogenase family protein [Reyranella soli]|uniref:acyl-CoA dehydrogenase family protein n=1 Tax=Reyranella soli TaxID=1230389 RepID=UPI0014785960|nr:acyl-CoA dehydrogenase family protein [Reyranella soli]
MQNPVSPVLASPQERARAVQAVLDKDGPEMDRRRELTQEVVDALAGQDLLRMLLPRSMGGQEVPLVDYARACEALAWADASTAWFVNQSNVSMATSAASMPHETAAAMFEGPYAGLAWGARHDKSKAIRVEGGYRLTGTWSFASGGRHTKWLGAHSAVQNPDGTPHTRYGRPDDRSFVFLRSQAKIIDDWHVLGLRGTGSDSYSVEDLFIPDAQAPARDVDDERREKGPLYPIGSTLLYATGFCSVTIGIARRLLDTYVTVVKGRHSRSSPMAMINNHAIQREMAILEARLSAVRAFLHEAAGQLYDASAKGTLDVDLRVRLRLATTWGMNEATDVSIACYRGAGTMAISEKAPFERRFRDAMSASQHLQGMWPHAEMVGRHLIGADNLVQFV